MCIYSFQNNLHWQNCWITLCSSSWIAVKLKVVVEDTSDGEVAILFNPVTSKSPIPTAYTWKIFALWSLLAWRMVASPLANLPSVTTMAIWGYPFLSLILPFWALPSNSLKARCVLDVPRVYGKFLSAGNSVDALVCSSRLKWMLASVLYIIVPTKLLCKPMLSTELISTVNCLSCS